MSNKDLFNTCIIRVGMPPVIDAIIDRIVKNKEKYVPVVKATGVPWWWIGIIHIMEAAGRFDCHLHNGDTLTARTTHEPKGRPLLGKPPFTWCDSAIDALHSRGLVKPNNLPGEGAEYPVWSLAFALDKMERYNGLGYRKTNIVSPYLWAGSTHYTKGKFVADGKFDPNAISKQIGGAVILSRMKARHILEI